jgi:hypothetical protein
VTWAALDAITGGLSDPSKMPGRAWGIPAAACVLGAMLRQLAGTVCRDCYALKGRFVFPNVKRSLLRKLDCWRKHTGQQWIEAMVASIRKDPAIQREPCFRWFHSGDLQSVAMLRDLAAVARRTPEVNYWVATRERGILAAYRAAGHTIPRNLCIRVSMPLVDSPVPKRRDRYPLSLVYSKTPQTGQGGECKDCRACWNRAVPVVTYRRH